MPATVEAKVRSPRAVCATMQGVKCNASCETGANFRRQILPRPQLKREQSPRPEFGWTPLEICSSATLVRDRRLGVRRVGRVLLDAADEIERGVQRLVVLWIRRNIGLRAGLLVASGLEVAAQRSLAARLGARLEFLGHVLQHLDVGRDTRRLDRTSGWGEVAGGGQPQRPVAG